MTRDSDFTPGSNLAEQGSGHGQVREKRYFAGSCVSFRLMRERDYPVRTLISIWGD